MVGTPQIGHTLSLIWIYQIQVAANNVPEYIHQRKIDEDFEVVRFGCCLNCLPLHVKPIGIQEQKCALIAGHRRDHPFNQDPVAVALVYGYIRGRKLFL